MRLCVLEERNMNMEMQVPTLENRCRISFIENKILIFLPKKIYFLKSRHLSIPPSVKSARCDAMDLCTYCEVQLKDYEL